GPFHDDRLLRAMDDKRSPGTPGRHALNATRSNETPNLDYPQPIRQAGARKRMAERVGFEPTDRLPGQRFSRPPHSTALAPLREISLISLLSLPRSAPSQTSRTA